MHFPETGVIDVKGCVRTGVVVLVVLFALAAGARAGWPTMQHSGTIIEIDETAGTMVLAEVGPWQQKNGRTVVTPRRIEIPSDTPLMVARRADDAPSGFPGDFVASPLAPRGLRRGDFVTVDCVHDGTRLIAQRITVSPTGAP